MAVTALRAIALLLSLALAMSADQAHDVLEVINHVATSLTDGDPSDALSQFSKSYENYNKLREYFSGLTDAFQISNEADVLDEQDKPDETSLVLQWSLNLTSKDSNENLRRTEEVHARLVKKNRHWEIVDFSPVTLFDPQFRAGGK
jgi:hypothetical protein